MNNQTACYSATVHANQAALALDHARESMTQAKLARAFGTKEEAAYHLTNAGRYRAAFAKHAARAGHLNH